MLKLFEVVGFKNFEEKLTFNFTNVRDYKFGSNCISNGFLSKMVVYGRNASGKSNLGLALFDIVSHLTTNNVTPGLYDYYVNINNKTNDVSFHYVFLFGKDEVDYQYIKNEKQDLIFESISINQIELFNYSYEYGRGKLDGLEKMFPTLNLEFIRNESILKYAISNSALPDNHPLYLMYHYVSKMLWFRSLDENRYIGFKSKSNDYFDFIFEDKNLIEFEEFLKKAGINETLIGKKDVDGVRRLYFNTKIPLPFFKVASSGTKALYTFFYWYKTAKDVSFMYIDEFDAFYHYELSEVIVKILQTMLNTQVVLTSHNTNLLSNRIMRPDCFFILSNGRITSFASATDRELREGHNLEKLYMSGEFNE